MLLFQRLQRAGLVIDMPTIKNSQVDNHPLAKQILIIKLDEIGDMVLLSPFLRELRKNEPDARITLVCRANTLPLIETCPYLDDFIPFEPIPKSCLDQYRLHVREFSQTHLQPKNFDVAIIPRYGIDEYFARWIAAHSGAREVVTYRPMAKERECVKYLASEGFNWIQREVQERHEVEKNLEILRHLGYRITDDTLEIWCQPADVARADRLLKSGREEERATIAIAPGARLPIKRWPWQRFALLSRRLADELNLRILLIGSKVEEEICKQIEQQLDGRAVNLAGLTSIRQTAAVLARCRGLISNDSAPIHLAAAMGIPCVGLYRGNTTRWKPWKNVSICLQGSDDPTSWNGPYQDRQPYYLSAITVDEVFDGASRLFR